MLENLLDDLQEGISRDGYTIYARKISQGRFREELNFELHYRYDMHEALLLNAKIFLGRAPDYLPWAELFGIEETLKTDPGHETYFGSTLEGLVLDIFSKDLGPGTSLFVEYYADGETREELHLDLPVVLTRLGHKMWELGFTWFKDWYFPEGYLEGNQKLQGQKPIDRLAEKRHIQAACNEVENFTRQIREFETHSAHIARALERSDSILRHSVFDIRYSADRFFYCV